MLRFSHAKIRTQAYEQVLITLVLHSAHRFNSCNISMRTIFLSSHAHNSARIWNNRESELLSWPKNIQSLSIHGRFQISDHKIFHEFHGIRDFSRSHPKLWISDFTNHGYFHLAKWIFMWQPQFFDVPRLYLGRPSRVRTHARPVSWCWQMPTP